MPFLGRARYNLLQQKKREDPSFKVEDWMVVNYRDFSLNELFDGLERIGVHLDVDDFEQLAEEYDSPEEFSTKFVDSIPEHAEEIYLYIFELWRRLLDQRETISIFCDEIDYLLSEVDEEHLVDGDLMHAMLVELADILDCNVDSGQKPKKVFSQVCSYMAHDLESAIYNFIFDQIEQGNLTIASELLGDFSEYIEESLWFDFLKIRLMRGVPSEDATAMMARFMEKLEERPNLELYFALLRHLIEIGDRDLFLATYRFAVDLIKDEEDYVEMTDILFEYFNLNDLEEEEKNIRTIIESRKSRNPSEIISPEDKDQLNQLASS